MRPFVYEKEQDVASAIQRAGLGAKADNPATLAPRQYLAGGTTLIDLMKLDVMKPDVLIDINSLDKKWSQVEINDSGLRLGALAKMSDVAAHPDILRDYPVIAQSLQLAASQQIRNMATLGGNVLQRTRCTYFRDVAYTNCNKRNPGSGCAAMQGVNRSHAVLGTSDQCIATYPGDFAQALVALDAQVEIAGNQGRRQIPFEDLHRLPGDRPDAETTLAQGELITAFLVKAKSARRSLYLKIRDRESYEFALASVAVVLDIRNGIVDDARLALGGLATKPWRAIEAERSLVGQKYTESLAIVAAGIAMQDARVLQHNKFKVSLGKQAVIRALNQVAAMEI